MSILLIDKIKQKNSGEFPLVDDIDLYGGFRVVSTTTDRDSIPSGMLKEGMWVYCLDTSKVYTLLSGLSSWDEVSLGGAARTSVTFSELQTLIAENSLTPGAEYLITDFATKHNYWDTVNWGYATQVNTASVEQLVVTAKTMNSLFTEAFSLDYPDDVLFYDVTNVLCEDDATARKGWIYRRIDLRRNIDICCDFRGVRLKRLNMPSSYATMYPTFDADNGTYYQNYIVMYQGNPYLCLQYRGPGGPDISDPSYFVYLNQGQPIGSYVFESPIYARINKTAGSTDYYGPFSFTFADTTETDYPILSTARYPGSDSSTDSFRNIRITAPSPEAFLWQVGTVMTFPDIVIFEDFWWNESSSENLYFNNCILMGVTVLGYDPISNITINNYLLNDCIFYDSLNITLEGDIYGNGAIYACVFENSRNLKAVGLDVVSAVLYINNCDMNTVSISYNYCQFFLESCYLNAVEISNNGGVLFGIKYSTVIQSNFMNLKYSANISTYCEINLQGLYLFSTYPFVNGNYIVTDTTGGVYFSQVKLQGLPNQLDGPNRFVGTSFPTAGPTFYAGIINSLRNINTQKLSIIIFPGTYAVASNSYTDYLFAGLNTLTIQGLGNVIIDLNSTGYLINNTSSLSTATVTFKDLTINLKAGINTIFNGSTISNITQFNFENVTFTGDTTSYLLYYKTKYLFKNCKFVNIGKLFDTVSDLSGYGLNTAQIVFENCLGTFYSTTGIIKMPIADAGSSGYIRVLNSTFKTVNNGAIFNVSPGGSYSYPNSIQVYNSKFNTGGVSWLTKYANTTNIIYASISNLLTTAMVAENVSTGLNNYITGIPGQIVVDSQILSDY